MADDEIVSEWVDENVVVNDTDTDSSVTDCCCTDNRTIIDNGNWCVKIPKEKFTVKETVDFCSVLVQLADYMPCFDYNYDGWHELVDAINQYKANSLLILEEHNCIKSESINRDVDYEGNDI